MIYILGVDHFTVQLPHQNNDAEKVAKFLEQVRNICQEKKIGLIAEESSEDALSYQNINFTHVGKIIPELGIEYLLCDPGLIERNRIGVKQRDIIAKELSIPFPPTTPEQEKNINEVAGESDRKREKYWLDQIKTRNVVNKEVLLICGFEHVDYFIDIAKKENCAVQKII
ncbi:MAG: hypothetical protein WCT29_00005 [Candidatus Paceibacterota bacterium]|jgi:hypothetical protein